MSRVRGAVIAVGRRLPPKARTTIKAWYRSHLVRRGRRATALLRPEPTFLIVGAMKAGTTSLLAYLGEFPDTYVAMRKEVAYFDLDPTRSRLWYRSHFPLLSVRHRFSRNRTIAVGEATPYYLFHPDVPERVAAIYPNCRIIVLLREPVSRAVSHYIALAASGREPLSLCAAIDHEISTPPAPPPESRTQALVSSDHRLRSYVRHGLYAEQLDRWMGHFERDAILILTSDHLFSDPAAVVQKVRRFLELDEKESPPSFEVHNPGRRLPPEADPDDLLSARQTLHRFYEGPNADLATRFGITWNDETGTGDGIGASGSTRPPDREV